MAIDCMVGAGDLAIVQITQLWLYYSVPLCHFKRQTLARLQLYVCTTLQTPREPRICDLSLFNFAIQLGML